MHKLYFKDQDILELLGDRIISSYKNVNGPSNDIDTFCGRLISAITYLKKDDENKIINLYNLVFNKKSKDIDHIYNKLIKFIEKSKKEGDKLILLELYDKISLVSSNKINIEEVKASDALFTLLNNFSKKKLLIYLLKKKIPQNKGESKTEYIRRLKSKINEITSLYKKDEDIISNSWELGLDDIYYQIALTFGKGYTSPINKLFYETDLNQNEVESVIKLLEESGVEKNVIKKIREYYDSVKDEENMFSIGEEPTIKNEEDISYLNGLQETERKNIADFNPYIMQLDFENGIKVLGFDRFIEIYKTTFSEIANNILDDTKGIKPSYSKFLKFDLNKLKGYKETKEKKIIFQYIIEFDTKNDFGLEDLKELAILVNQELGTINLETPTINEEFNHPLTTIKGTQTYDGYFSDSGEKFADDNIILIKGEKEKKVRLTLSYFNQDNFIYLISQIGNFIAHGKFKKRNQLYFDIYNRYNTTLFSSTLYDISILKDNYKKFFKNIILPFTKEGIEIGIKPSNMILAGVYGTGKSQFLKHILLNKKWKFNGKEFFLNANIIPLGLQEFKSLLASGIGGIKTRLDEIYNNTKAPIIIIVEDIDTLVNEKMHGINDEMAQALTILFEGVGSLPINFITTSNDPTKFSERLIRPERLEEIIIFNTPTIPEKKEMLDAHLKIKGLELNKNILEIIYNSNIIKYGTSSHIGKLVKDISNYIKMKAIFGDKKDLSEKEIKEIISNIAITRNDIEETEKRILEWYDSIKGNKTKKVGFKA